VHKLLATPSTGALSSLIVHHRLRRHGNADDA